MILEGEDPRFIARRLIVTAAEDVGNADPQALLLALAAAEPAGSAHSPGSSGHLYFKGPER